MASLTVPDKEEHNAPLSFSQQRLWLLDQLDTNACVYNVCWLFKIVGSVKHQILKKAFAQVIQRHHILRSNIVMRDNKPVQVVHDSIDFSFKFQNLSHLSTLACWQSLKQQFTHECTTAFDLEKDPLLRGTLVRCREDVSYLFLTLHHVVVDGWSMGVLVKELGVYYQNLTLGQEGGLPAITTQYADFSEQQQKDAHANIWEKEIDYWQVQLKAPLTVLEVYGDKMHSRQPGHKGARLFFKIDPLVFKPLKQLAKQQKVTLFMLLIAAYKVLLYRYTGTQDMIVGTPIANRMEMKTWGLIGFFINTIAMRSDLSGNPSFNELLARVKKTAVEAFHYQNVPFDKLVEVLNPHRESGQSPLFQTFFILQNNQIPDASFGDIKLEMVNVDYPDDADFKWVPNDTGWSEFNLCVELIERPDCIVGAFEYNTQYFSQAYIQSLSQHFVQLLKSIVENPDQSISFMNMMASSELAQLDQWNHTHQVYPDLPVHHLFTRQAAKTPHQIAVIKNLKQISYIALDQQSNQLAHFLIEQGIRPNDTVGLCVERSIALAVALLAILKAGAAYIPLDPAYPKERLAYMLEIGHATMVVTQSNLVSILPDIQTKKIILDVSKSDINRHHNGTVKLETKASQLAYIMFTSGSTGNPKGVMMPHSALANLIHWQCQNSHSRTHVDDHARTAQCAPISFDVSFQEMFSTWSTGGALVMVDESLRQDYVALLALLQDLQVSRLFLPFVALQQLAEVATEISLYPDQLRQIITAGEQLRVTNQIANFFRHLSDCVLCNQYGPAETHVVTEFKMPDNIDDWDTLPPIGKVIDNGKLYILDQHLSRVPIGVPGELYFGGKSIAAGYMKRDDLTQARFIDNPFESGAGKMYKTGDRAVMLPTGDVKFLGRMDAQIKIRGYRIEPSEIEAVLVTHPAIREVVVHPYLNEAGHYDLVAYYVSLLGIGRIRLNCECEVVLPDEQMITVDIKDVSQNGLRMVNLPDTIKVGDSLTVNVSHPLLDPVTLFGWVVWEYQGGAGFQVSEQSYYDVKNIIKTLLSSPDFDPESVTRYDSLDPIRQDFRIPYQGLCLLSVNDQTIATQITNLSAGGVALSNITLMLQDIREVMLSLKLPGKTHLLGIKGEIVWHQKDNAGIRFCHANDSKQIIYEMIQQNIQVEGFYIQYGQSQIRRFVKDRLPEYMVPGYFEELDCLPLTPSGKINRLALPRPSQIKNNHSKGLQASTETETKLVAIWQQILTVDTIYIQDDFFELGGHSLLASQVVSRIRSVFGVEIPFQDFFASATIKDLAYLVDHHYENKAPIRLPPIIHQPSKDGCYPLSYAQERMWIIYQLEPGSPAYNMPAAVRMDGIVDKHALALSIDTLINRHEILRTLFVERQEEPVQIVQSVVQNRLQYLEIDPHTLQQVLDVEAQKPFDISREMPIRALLINLGHAESVLFINLHHIVSDGWSISVLVKEITQLYQHFAQGDIAKPDALPIQYYDYAQWQIQWLSKDTLKAQQSYWLEKLAGLQELRLPFDHPRPEISSFKGAEIPMEIPAVSYTQLATLARKQGVTTYMALLALFQSVLFRYTWQDDIAIGSPVAGRTRPELEGLVGFFANTLVMRTTFHGNPSYLDILSRVRQTTLAAYAHQDVPFEWVSQALKVQHSNAPMIQVLFNLQHYAMTELSFSGIELTQLNLDRATAKFDLVMMLWEEEEGAYGALEYSTDLFEARTIERMLAHYMHLLGEVIKHPNQPVAELLLEVDTPTVHHNTEHDMVNTLNQMSEQDMDVMLSQLLEDE